MDEIDLLRRHRPVVPPPGDDTRARAAALLAAAQAAEAPRPRRTRVPVLAATAAVFAAVVVLVVGGGPPTTQDTLTGGPLAPARAAAAVEVVREDRYVEVRFLEPAADEQRIADELRAAGLDVEVVFVPASPSLEWRLTAAEGDDGIEYLPPDAAGGGPAAIRVSSDYGGGARLGIGRPARPGEAYDASPAEGAEMPGEALHCSRLSGMRVDDAQGIIAARRLVAEWRTVRTGLLGGGTMESLDPAGIADWYVADTTPWAPGEVVVWVDEAPPPVLPAVEQLRNAGCAAGGAR